MKITLQLISDELALITKNLDTISLYPLRWASTREQIIKDLFQRRDDLLFERDEILKLQKKPIYQQIIDTVGGEEAFCKLAGIKQNKK